MDGGLRGTELCPPSSEDMMYFYSLHSSLYNKKSLTRFWKLYNRNLHPPIIIQTKSWMFHIIHNKVLLWLFLAVTAPLPLLYPGVLSACRGAGCPARSRGSHVSCRCKWPEPPPERRPPGWVLCTQAWHMTQLQHYITKLSSPQLQFISLHPCKLIGVLVLASFMSPIWYILHKIFK